MNVSYDEDAINAGDIIKAVQDAGYQAAVESDKVSSDDADKKNKSR